MTDREAAIVSAYTGILIGSFSVMHGYIEETMDRPVWMHEMGSRDFSKRVKDAARPDFLAIEVDGVNAYGSGGV